MKKIFLTELDEIRELRPEDTDLVPDNSARHRRSRLYIESLLRLTPPTDSRLHLGHRAAINPTEYQLTPAARALTKYTPAGTASLLKFVPSHLSVRTCPITRSE